MPSESATQYGPPRPTKACTSCPPILITERSTGVEFAPVPVRGMFRSGSPFSNANSPLTYTNWLIESVTSAVARRNLVSRSITSGSPPVGIESPPVPNVALKSTTLPVLLPFTLIFRFRTSSVSASIPTSCTLPVA